MAILLTPAKLALIEVDVCTRKKDGHAIDDRLHAAASAAICEFYVDGIRAVYNFKLMSAKKPFQKR